MPLGALTWLGLMIVALGWGLLFSAAPLVELLPALMGRSIASLTNLTAIAECAIMTGLGLAIIGTLQSGFGALKNFFDAVLERTTRREAVEETAKPAAAVAKSERKPLLARREPHVDKKTRIVERGRLKDRAYVLFGDGSVEVETLLGLRRFASLGEAHEFIG